MRVLDGVLVELVRSLMGGEYSIKRERINPGAGTGKEERMSELTGRGDRAEKIRVTYGVLLEEAQALAEELVRARASRVFGCCVHGVILVDCGLGWKSRLV